MVIFIKIFIKTFSHPLLFYFFSKNLQNPKEPAARHQTVTKYVKAQRALLKEEALARAQAMQEAKQLDSKVRDAYTQLRNSAFVGNHVNPDDAIRIKPPTSAPSGGHAHHRTQSREITLLENGMIVEHVDVRREEREAKERKRREDKRARKSSRSSAVEVTSIISANSNGRHTDNGSGLKPYSRYSQASSARPVSILTAPHERPDLPRAYSQASFSDVHSLGSSSPKRRFFGFRNLSAGWRSQDSLAPSAMTGGSMVDMQYVQPPLSDPNNMTYLLSSVALQRESNKSARYFSGTPIDLNSPRRSQIWPPEPETSDTTPTATVKSKADSGKKTTALAKFWRKVTGHKNDHTSNSNDQREPSCEKVDDDLPLAPPPPLSRLVDGGSSEMVITGGRQNSAPPTTPSPPKFGFGSPGMSPMTAPSSPLPSPVSSRLPGQGFDTVEIRHTPGGRFDDTDEPRDDNFATAVEAKSLHSVLSVPDMRQRNGSQSSSPLPPVPSLPQSMQAIDMVFRDKSLPPIPPGEDPAPLRATNRPRTVYTYDPAPLPPGTGRAHDFLPPNAPFRTGDIRRQSFSGLSNPHPQPTHTNGKSATYDPRKTFGPRYDEFGTSRRSLGRIENTQESAPPMPRSAALTKNSKRKSKFGLSSLLGKKNKSQDFLHDEKSAFIFPTTQDGQDEWCVGYPTSDPRYSGLGMGSPGQFNPRMSVISKKGLEELVSQDPEFVAYRYPSHDQRLDLLR